MRRTRRSAPRKTIVGVALLACVTVAACEPRTLLLLPEGPSAQAGGAPAASGSGAVPGSPASGGAGGGNGGEGSGGVELRAALVVDVLPNGDDELFLGRLRTLGLVVDPVPQAAANSDTLAFADLVVVAPSADGAVLGASLVGLEKPELILEPAVVAAQSLGPVLALTTAKTRIDVIEPSHPLAAGREGVLEVCSTTSLTTSNNAPDGAVVVATANLNANAAVLYALPADTVVGETSLPADRVVYSVIHAQGCRTDLAWEFFDASVEWLLRDAR